jgi:cell division protein FtsQ
VTSNQEAGRVAGPARTVEREREPLRPESGPPAGSGRTGRPVRRRRLPGRGLLVVGLVLTALFGGFGVWALYGSQWLRVETVSVSWTGGPRELDRAEIEEAAAVPLGTPMATLDKGAVSERVRERLPRVRSVEVVRAWPHGVGLKVTERQAEVLIPGGGTFTEVDAEGIAFGELAEALPAVPLLEMDLTAGPGLRRFGEDRILRGAVEVAAALPDALREDTRVIRVRSYDAISLELSGNRTVVWGSPEYPEAKAAALKAVMKAAPDADHFDVSVPSAPAAAVG